MIFFQKKKDYDANPYFCEVCLMDCTSEDAFENHLKGKIHLKKLKLQLGKVFCLILD